jgi:hypothetical protein
LRTVALIEASKGTLVLLVGFGLLSLAHHDAQRIAEQWVAHSRAGSTRLNSGPSFLSGISADSHAASLTVGNITA